MPSNNPLANSKLERNVPPLGIFAKTFPRATVEEVFAMVAAHGLDRIQFNFACAGLPSLPEQTPPTELLDRIHRAARSRGIALVGLSGTFNMIHPDLQKRHEGFRRLDALLATCGPLRVNTVTLCTGTRDPDDMWKSHSENQSPEAWRDLVSGLERVLPQAEALGLTLAVEPEIGNVINSAAAARRLLDEMRSPSLRLILDPANLFPNPALTQTAMESTMAEAFELLGTDIVMAHAKELGRDGHAGGLALGRGILNWDVYLRGLIDSGYNGPLVMHGFSEKEAEASIAFLRDKLNSFTKN